MDRRARNTCTRATGINWHCSKPTPPRWISSQALPSFLALVLKGNVLVLMVPFLLWFSHPPRWLCGPLRSGCVSPTPCSLPRGPPCGPELRDCSDKVPSYLICSILQNLLGYAYFHSYVFAVGDSRREGQVTLQHVLTDVCPTLCMHMAHVSAS